MIEVQKTITDNPFVDNLIYYSKFLALNSTIKDEKEALANETPESLKAGDVYIACIEGRAKYEMFKSIPVEVLEKYIKQTSNLDLFASNLTALSSYLNSLGLYQRTNVLNNLSKLAQTVYIDHYDIMTNYVKGLSPTWLDDNKELYDKCKNSTATYDDLFDIIPLYTRKRILIQYLNNYDNSDIDSIASTLSGFKSYILSRTDTAITSEVNNINKAMRNVFASHYEIMKERGYVTKTSQNNWYDYLHFADICALCENGKATYKELFDLFPQDDLKESLSLIIKDANVINNIITIGLDALISYFSKLSDKTKENQLNENMRKKYTENYHLYANTDIYYKSKYNKIDYYELSKYIPFETLKMILNTEIEEFTNLKVYSENKEMLNSYLNGLPYEEAEEIKNNIAKETTQWYIDNMDETNNYYRTFIGLPPLIEEFGIPYKDTLLESQIDAVNSYKFGNKFINMIPEGIYPEAHWKAPLYTYDNYDISILMEYGVLDAYVQACKSNMYSKRYSYIRYLGDAKLNLYTCRKASNFQLIGMPAVDNSSIKNKFMDKYAINRDYVLRTVYSEAYEFQSDYYTKFIIIFILVNTIMDLLAGISRMLIDRDVFDSRCIKYLFESYGIPYYSEIPVKYQQAMLKNLNILIKYKSSTRNMVDICNLFGFSDIRVFGYYMLKERVVDSNTGEYIFKENNNISYDLDKLYVIDKSNGKYTDINGVKYTKLLEYRNYDKNKYLKTISIVNDDKSITEKQIINNAAEIYIMDTWKSSPTVAKNNDTGLYEEVSGTTETCYKFIPLLETDYFYKIKDYDDSHYCYNESTDEYFKKINANTDEATLKFTKVPINESLADYKSDDEYIASYDEITYSDQGNTWDGGLQHEDVKKQIIDQEFNAVLTKYVSVETVTHMTELAFQVSYFYNMLFDNLYSEEHLTVEIPFIKVGHKFKFMDVLCYLFALMYYYNGIKDTIMYSPTQILYIKGYNFDEDLNKVMDDTLAFTTKDSNGNSLSLAERENIFDINKAINEANYDYNKAFEYFKIKSFNLDVDMDELDTWLSQFQMSLDDFIVYDLDQAKANGFNQVITLRNFYSLNNSFYQKTIFSDALLPSQYNNDIKYAFDYILYPKQYINDMDGTQHEYVIIKSIKITNGDTTKIFSVTNSVYDYYAKILQYHKDNYKNIQIQEDYLELLDGTTEFVYIMNNSQYVARKNINHSIYRKYHKVDNNYVTADIEYYTYNEGSYFKLVEGDIYIKDKNGEYIFATNKFYKKVEDNYVEITDSKNFYTDGNKRKIIKFGDYYIYQNGKYVLDPNNCYIIVEKAGEEQYVLVKDLDKYKNEEVDASNCYILHSDGHFIPLIDTDFYRKQPDGTYKYDKEICYVRTTDVTSYYDPSDNPRIYYKKLSEYYAETFYILHKDTQYVKDSDGNFIPENQLVDPNNCYYNIKDTYLPVIENMFTFKTYSKPLGIKCNLIMDSNYDYNRYKLSDTKYLNYPDTDVRYVKNSDKDFITGLSYSVKYQTTKSMIVVLNRAIVEGNKFDAEYSDKYNPEITDKIWDENDWFYQDPSYQDTSIGMSGENTWYYKKPGVTPVPEEDEEKQNVGSGFYLAAETYIGDVKIEKGIKYYMAMDVETNFSGQLQISCESDSSCTDSTCRIYDVTAGVKFHVGQTFIANDIKSPKIKFLVYSFKEYPIEVGDYIITSDIKFMKSFNNEYIPQDIPSYDKLQEIYKTNEAIYKYLITMMQNCSDYDTYQIYKKLYDSMMVSEYNKEAFKLEDGRYAKTYTEFLQTRDSALYERLTYFLSLDEDTMHKEIADNIIEVTYAIDDCVDTYSYGYLYSYFPAVSANYIQQYISKIINFFKSWKVHLLGINTVYKFDDPLENTIKILEDQQYRNRDIQDDFVHIAHSAYVNPIDATDPAGHKYTDKYPDLIKYSHKYTDKVNIEDRVRIITRDANMIKYTDNYENVHLILNNDDIKPYVDENGNLIVNNGAGLSVKIPNELIYSADETYDVFGSQNISNINDNTIDIVGGNKENE